MKPKLVFIDHSDHVKTNSSRFFSSILERKYEVQYLYSNPNDATDTSLFDFGSKVDRVVIWQMDCLAPLAIASGIPTIVVPMYDGSSLMPDLHWHWAKQASFINFSRRLHSRITRLGNHSLLLKYYVRPVEKSRKAKFDHGLHALCWERRPEDGIHANLIRTIFGSQLKTLHLHECPDIKQQVKRHTGKRPDPFPFRVTKSSWFRSQSDFLDIMDRCNVFICPRASEGIGMAMLEALSRGMLVLAQDDATHDEYIANWVNGVLFNKNHPSEACFDSAAELGDLAWHGAHEGYEKWKESEEKVLSFIADAPAPRIAPFKVSERFIHDLAGSYAKGPAFYERFLKRNLKVISEMSAMPEEELLGEGAFEATPENGAELKKQQLPMLTGRLMSFDNNDPNSYVETGWGGAEPGWRWIEGKSASLVFSLPFDDTACTHLTIRARTLKEIGKSTDVCLVLNNVAVGFIRMTPHWTNYQVEIPIGALGVKNRLQIYSSGSGSSAHDRRELSVAVVSIKLS